MTMKRLFCLIVLTMMFVSGCAGTIQEIITCDPPLADIYWGKTESELKTTGHKTPHSRSISGSNWESWCYQVKKEGYHDSEIICREEDGSRYLDFRLIPLKTTVTSDPPEAIIYWGPSEAQIEETTHRTPRTLTAKDHSGGASWKDWYFQVKKEGYHDSEIVFVPRHANDRYVHFDLKPISQHSPRKSR
jgi:hypothetical protein